MMRIIKQTDNNREKKARGRLYARVLAAIFIACFVLFSGGAALNAQSAKVNKLQKSLQNDITLSADVGVDNTFFPLHLNPVNIIINNGTSSNFEGEILIEAAGNYYRIVNVFVGALSSKKYSVNTQFETYTYSVKVSIINSSNIVIYDEKINVKANQAKDYYILNISESHSYISDLRNIPIAQKRGATSDSYSSYSSAGSEKPSIIVHRLKADEIFDNFACYEPYSLVIINGADASLMSSVQQRALIEYAAAGGALMFSYGGFVSKISASELAGVLPVTIKGSEIVDGSDFYKYAATQNINGVQLEKFKGALIPISVGEIKNGATATLNYTAGDGRVIPLIAHSRPGLGMVYYAAFDISQIDIGRIDYLKENIAGILKQSELNKNSKMSSLARQFSKYCEQFNHFIIEPPSAWIVILLLISFALLIGPIFYFFIKNSVTMTKLIMIPAGASILFFALFNFFDVEFLLNKPSIAELNLMLIDNPSAQLQMVSNVAILMPPMSAGEYDVDMNRATLISNTKGYYGQSAGEIIINEDTIKLIHPQMDYRFSKYSIVKQSGFNAKFSPSYTDEPAGSYAAAQPEKSMTVKQNSTANKKPPYAAQPLKSEPDEIQPFINAAAFAKNAKKLKSIVNNTGLELLNCKVYYCGKIFALGNLPPGANAAEDAAAFKTPEKFISAKQIDDHFNDISETISGLLPKNLNYNRYSHGYNHYNKDNFINQAALYIAKNSSAAPVMVGYVKKGAPSSGDSIKTSGCDTNDLGSIAIIKL
jgi:hypothetical protein